MPTPKFVNLMEILAEEGDAEDDVVSEAATDGDDAGLPAASAHRARKCVRAMEVTRNCTRTRNGGL